MGGDLGDKLRFESIAGAHASRTVKALDRGSDPGLSTTNAIQKASFMALHREMQWQCHPSLDQMD